MYFDLQLQIMVRILFGCLSVSPVVCQLKMKKIVKKMFNNKFLFYDKNVNKKEKKSASLYDCVNANFEKNFLFLLYFFFISVPDSLV